MQAPKVRASAAVHSTLEVPGFVFGTACLIRTNEFGALQREIDVIQPSQQPMLVRRIDSEPDGGRIGQHHETP